MKKIRHFILTVCLLFISFLFFGCEEDKTLSKTEYASSVVTVYEGYSDKFDEITEAMQKGQRVTATVLCDEAATFMDEISSLAPPTAFKDEHEKIKEYSSKEKRKLELLKEYIEIAKDEANLSEEQLERISVIQEESSLLSLESDKFYALVYQIADKQLDEREGTQHALAYEDFEE